MSMLMKLMAQTTPPAAPAEGGSAIWAILQGCAAIAVIVVVVLFLRHLKDLRVADAEERRLRAEREAEQRAAEVKAREDLAERCHEQHKELTQQCAAVMSRSNDVIERNTVAHDRTLQALARAEKA